LDLLEEIKEVGQSSFEATQRAAQAVPEKPSEEALSFFRDIILDLRANTLAFYKVAILQARRELYRLVRERYAALVPSRGARFSA
jgi:hypothetical protein